MRERHVRLAAAPDIAPLIRATSRSREVVIVDGVALRDEFLVPPAAAVVAPPNLSAHQPAGYAASRHDDPPQMPGGWFGSAPLQSKLADGDGCKSDRWHDDPFGSSCPLQASPQRASRRPHHDRGPRRDREYRCLEQSRFDPRDTRIIANRAATVVNEIRILS